MHPQTNQKYVHNKKRSGTMLTAVQMTNQRLIYTMDQAHPGTPPVAPATQSTDTSGRCTKTLSRCRNGAFMPPQPRNCSRASLGTRLTTRKTSFSVRKGNSASVSRWMRCMMPGAVRWLSSWCSVSTRASQMLSRGWSSQSAARTCGSVSGSVSGSVGQWVGSVGGYELR